MGKVVVNNIVSVDGYFADEAGNPVVLNMDGSFDAYNLERIRAAGTVLLGRSSFEGFGSYWPFIADAPADPGRAVDQTNREISRIYNRIPKVVVSDSFVIPDDHVWADTSTVVPRDAVAEWINAQRNRDDGEILIFASHLLWNSLLTDGLVDELHLTVSPTVLGSGIPLFTAPAALRLLDARPFPGSDNVLLVYAPAGG